MEWHAHSERGLSCLGVKQEETQNEKLHVYVMNTKLFKMEINTAAAVQLFKITDIVLVSNQGKPKDKPWFLPESGHKVHCGPAQDKGLQGVRVAFPHLVHAACCPHVS